MTPLPPVRFRFTIDYHVTYWSWTLTRSRGRGRRRIELLSGRPVETEAECRADAERARGEIARAAITKERPC